MRELLPCFLGLLWIAGCSATNNLVKHPLDGQTVTIVADMHDAPFVDFDMTIFDRVGQDLPVFERQPSSPTGIPPVVIGTISHDEDTPEQQTPVHGLIDSVLAQRTMSDLLIQLVEAKGQQQLQFVPVASLDEADYVLNLKVHDYGIGADSWKTPVYFEISATLTLIHQESGKPLWQDEVQDLVTVPKALLKAGMPNEKTATPSELAKKSYGEMKEIIDGLARYSADQLTQPLRDAYRDTIEKETARLL